MSLFDARTWPKWAPILLGGVGVLALFGARSTSGTIPGGTAPQPAPAPQPPFPVTTTNPNPITTTPPPNAADVLNSYSQYVLQAGTDITGYQGQEALLRQLVSDLTAIGETAKANDVQQGLLTVYGLDGLDQNGNPKATP